MSEIVFIKFLNGTKEYLFTSQDGSDHLDQLLGHLSKSSLEGYQQEGLIKQSSNGT